MRRRLEDFVDGEDFTEVFVTKKSPQRTSGLNLDLGDREYIKEVLWTESKSLGKERHSRCLRDVEYVSEIFCAEKTL